MENSRAITFVYLGKDLPDYAIASIELASRYSGLDISLIGNASVSQSLRKSPAKFTPIEDFYDDKEFQDASQRLFNSHTFREGFWLKALERFFVISQYMDKGNLKNILHAELDQLLFRSDVLLSRLEQEKKQGLFVPLHTSNLAVASMLYCNSQNALRSLLDFASTTEPFSSEMVLLARWAKENPEQVSFLPTLSSEMNPSTDSFQIKATLSAREIGGFVDAAQIGGWIAGVDPRNIPFRQKPLTRFVEDYKESILTRHHLAGLKFNFNIHDGFMKVEYGEGLNANLFNLHLHSKIHRYLLNSDPSFERIIYYANESLPLQIPGTRRVQVHYRTATFVKHFARNPLALVNGVRRRLNIWLGRRPASSPYLSGDTFRAMANHIWETGNEDINPSDIKPGDVVFCQSEMLEDLHVKVLSYVHIPFTLLLGNSDRNHTESLAELLASIHSVKVWAQNLVEQVPGVEPLPIGLENAWYSTNGRPRDFSSCQTKSQNRISRIMWTFNLDTNLIVRTKAAKDLLKSPISDRLGLLTPKQHRSALTRYSFVASPPGNGLDCHRTWEAMYLGCVPIVLRSHMTQTYELLGLPVWVIDSFEEVCSLTEEQLRAKFIEMSPNFKSEALWSSYWINRIRN